MQARDASVGRWDGFLWGRDSLMVCNSRWHPIPLGPRSGCLSDGGDQSWALVERGAELTKAGSCLRPCALTHQACLSTAPLTHMHSTYKRSHTHTHTHTHTHSFLQHLPLHYNGGLKASMFPKFKGDASYSGRRAPSMSDWMRSTEKCVEGV